MECELVKCLGDNLLGISRVLEEHNHYIKASIAKATNFDEIRDINVYLENSLLTCQKVLEKILIVRCI